MAERSDKRELQERELKELLAGNPAEGRALERLAVLATQAGNRALAEELHRKKAEVDRAFDTFRKIVLDESTMADHAAELAKLADLLRRDFDATAWSIVELRVGEELSQARLLRAEYLTRLFPPISRSGHSSYPRGFPTWSFRRRTAGRCSSTACTACRWPARSR